MCWNAEVSLQSFGIGILAIGIAVFKGLPLPTALFCLTVTFMQLIEYVVWTYYDNPTVNFQASIAAILLLWLQPIASMLTLSKNLFPSFFISYIVLTILHIFFREPSFKEHFRMFRGDNGHLVWNWIQKDTQTRITLFFYFLFLFVPIILSQEFLLLGISLATLFLSLFSYYQANTWGSMWCWIVNYIVVGVSIRQVLQ